MTPKPKILPILIANYKFVGARVPQRDSKKSNPNNYQATDTNIFFHNLLYTIEYTPVIAFVEYFLWTPPPSFATIRTVYI